ncbi:TauD/TfdA family dioxygenase [Streptomyces sp. NPDC059785]|uniref:TauD/TfdA family dioxygenase n=1 Tax=Streptomyces sp. NPDC059785 TaxID=3346945 RepID=UPI00365E1209
MKIVSRSGRPLGEHGVLPSLMREGIVFLSETDRDEVIERFRGVLTACRHPHSPDTPWTVIGPCPETGRPPGTDGFTHEALTPHTDRSIVDAPPAVLCFLMLEEAAVGGHALLVDTASLLWRYRPDALHRIADDLWLTDRAHLWRRKIVEIDRSGYTVIRYRDDEVARPEARSRLSESLILGLRSEIRRTPEINLRSGQGYMIHNHRVLHGRTCFAGVRKGIRILFRVDCDSAYHALNKGFMFRRHGSLPEGDM